MNPRHQAGLERLVRAMDERTQPGDSHLSRAISLTAARDEESLELAHSGLEMLLEGKPLDIARRGLWEAIVHEHERPAINILGDQLQQVPWPWTDKLAEHPERWKLASRAVGRLALETPSPTRPFLGTGVLVAKDKLLTNRHVAEAFVLGPGTTKLWHFPDMAVVADLRQEIVQLDMFPPVLLTVERALLVHPHWDLAVLQVSGVPEGRDPVLLDPSPPAQSGDETKVMVIGFPARDDRNDMALQQRIFSTFGHKRAQPGTLRDLAAQVTSYGHTVEALAHDCSTLGGNSGSPVFDVETGRVLGIHFAGAYLEDNWAVPSWELARDPQLVDLGLFEEGVEAPKPGPWDQAWEAAERTPPEIRGPVGVTSAPLDAALFERLDDDGLRERLAAASEATQRDLVQLLGPDETEALLRDLAVVGDGAEAVDPNLPELVYLHGILGGHLRASRRRVWCAPLAFVSGDLDDRLALGAGGQQGTGGLLLSPDGHLRLTYSKAARRWRRQGFAVHEWSYDWRRPIEDAAWQLHFALERLALDRPGRDFVLVAHSMGGLVTALYATLDGSRWQDRLQRVVLMGSPLGGSFAPMEAGLGTYPFIQKLAWITAGADAQDLGTMCRTMPGLLDMLPNPTLFPDAAPLYDPATWGDTAPLDAWLRHSRELKARLWESPVLARTRALATVTLGTVDRHHRAGGVLRAGPRTGAGDGTVPARCAVHPQVPTWQATTEHSDLPGDDAVIAAVARMAQGLEPTGLTRLDASALPAQAPVTEAPALEALPEAHVEALAQRLSTGRWTHADARWLLSSTPLPLPAAAPDSEPLPTEAVVGPPGAAWQARAAQGGSLGLDGLDPERAAAALSLAAPEPPPAWPRWTLLVTPTQGAPQGRVLVSWRIPQATPHWRLVVDLGARGLDWVAPTPPVGTAEGPGELFEVLLPAGVTPEEHAVLGIPGPQHSDVDTEEGVWQTVQRKLRWRRRFRTFTKANRLNWKTSAAEELEASDARWTAMHDATTQGDRALWLLHGTGKQCHEGFGFFEPEELDRLHAHYTGGVYGFDHFTLRHSIQTNVQDLRSRMPSQALDLHVDVVAISRGGLLARYLSEGHGAQALRPHRLRVGNLVFVGTPNRGTPQAGSSSAAKAALRRAMRHDSDTEDLSGGTAEDVDRALAASDWRLFPGQDAMAPGSALLAQLQDVASLPAEVPRYHALTATFKAGREPKIDRLFEGEAHDLIVPTSGVWDPAHPAALFPIPAQRRLNQGSVTNHHRLLAPQAARTQVLDWLGVP